MNTTELSQKIQGLDSKALHELLKDLQLYKTLTKQLGDRGKAQYNRDKKGEKLLIVEHFTSVGEDLAWELAQGVYKKSFSLNIDRLNVRFVKSDALKGGIKVYCDDSVVDLSFAKIEATIRK